ncbi:MAG: hypothetical protein DRQ37_01665 [Gammaproteobacteria bacterium]|nr:MAG: hypothetical protein DRQ37_01665 [Gammaproteobacteria bacterium]
MNSRLAAIAASLVACLLILLWYQSGTTETKQPAALIPVRIADTGTSPPGLLLQLAVHQGLFEAEGLRPVIITQFAHGAANIEAVLRGDADIATASEVPVMRAGLQEKSISVLATIGRGDRHLAVVARKDRGIATLADLSGKTLGVTIGSNAEYFFDSLLASKGQKDKTLRKVHTLPRDMARTLAAGGVDAIVSWFPNWKHAEEALGDNAVTYFGDGIYTVFFNLISTHEFIGRNPDVVSRLLRVFIRAEKYANAHPQETKTLLKTVFQLSEVVADEVFANYALQVWIGQEFLIALEDEAQRAITKGLTKQTEIPNYLNLVHLDSLKKVSPEAVSIIH